VLLRILQVFSLKFWRRGDAPGGKQEILNYFYLSICNVVENMEDEVKNSFKDAKLSIV
jgi:hypothetical protein